jgi:magnesium chelatase subunit D
MRIRPPSAKTKPSSKTPVQRKAYSARAEYPFSAIVGQEEMKLALLLNAIDPTIGGALLMGHRGTGKSTAVRALADLLPPFTGVSECFYRCDPLGVGALCSDCEGRVAAGVKLKTEKSAVRVVDLPLGATEDRVCGAIDIERALAAGVKAFEPGLLARANRGFLYVDEVNLLEDHLVDLLLDVAVTGRNRVEREGISVEHPAHFVLIGSGNPEEGELRPQLVDRFGLHVEVKTELDPDRRVEIVERADAFQHDAEGFHAQVEPEQAQLRRKIVRAQRTLRNVKLPASLLRHIAELCIELKVEGHRGELTIMRAARALAAFEGRRSVTGEDVRRVAMMALRHRLRRDPLDEGGGATRIEQALEKLFPQERELIGAERAKRSRHDGDEPNNNGSSRPNQRESDPRGAKGSDFQIEAPAAAADARLPTLPLNRNWRAPSGRRAPSSRRQALSRRGSLNGQRGRYVRALQPGIVGSRVAVDATMRASLGKFEPGAAGWRVSVNENPAPGKITGRDLRFKQFSRKQGTLFILAIDASGSMALNRINQAKGALIRLLRQSHINRDSVAIVVFRGNGAQVLLPPSRSMARARRVLDSITIGGGTPLSAGLACSVQLARRSAAQHSGETVLLLFTDGHANVPLSANGVKDRAARRLLIEEEVKRLGGEMRKGGLEALVINTQNAFGSNGEALALAENLGAGYLPLPKFPLN